MKMLSFQLLSKECHHHRFLALYSLPLLEALRDILRAPQGHPCAPQGPQMTTMKPEIISPEPQMVPLRAQKVPNHLFADQNTPPEIPIDISGIPSDLPLNLSDIPDVQTDLPGGPRWPICSPRWLLMDLK